MFFAVVGWVCSCWVCAAQENRTWHATSTTARSITGDVTLANAKMAINYSSWPIAQIRALQPSRTRSAAFDLDGTPEGTGILSGWTSRRKAVSSSKNTLCGGRRCAVDGHLRGGSQPAAGVSSRGRRMPVLTGEAMVDGTNLCGTFPTPSKRNRFARAAFLWYTVWIGGRREKRWLAFRVRGDGRWRSLASFRRNPRRPGITSGDRGEADRGVASGAHRGSGRGGERSAGGHR